MPPTQAKGDARGPAHNSAALVPSEAPARPDSAARRPYAGSPLVPSAAVHSYVISFMVWHNAESIDQIQALVQAPGRKDPVKCGTAGRASKISGFNIEQGETLTHICGVATKRYARCTKKFARTQMGELFTCKAVSAEEVACSLTQYFHPAGSTTDDAHDVRFRVIVTGIQFQTSRGRISPRFGKTSLMTSSEDTQFIMQLSANQQILRVDVAESVHPTTGFLNPSRQRCRLLTNPWNSMLLFLVGRFPSCGSMHFVLERCKNCHEHNDNTHHVEQRYVDAFNRALDEIFNTLPYHAIDADDHPQPRIGSFEVSWCRPDGVFWKLFSKLELKRFPIAGELELAILQLQSLQFDAHMQPVLERPVKRTAGDSSRLTPQHGVSLKQLAATAKRPPRHTFQVCSYPN